MMYQFTPGPWAVKSRKVFAKDEVGIAAVIAGHKGFSESSANLVLMAASPDLLRVASELLAEYEGGGYCASKELIERAHAAIAKATNGD